MKLEEIKNKTNKAVSYLVAALESGESEVLTQYLNAMARFHHYSFGNIMLIARQRAMTCCYTSLESMNMRLYALLEASDGEYHIC
jgi:DNA-binding phage protein